MRAPLSWLRDYAPLDAPVERLARTLSEIGLVVEGVEEVGGGLADVVVAKVLAIRPHPDADRIRLVDVDPGDGGARQIVCGAWNFAEGDLVPLAPVGAVLPGGFRISKRKMRGEVSNGMLCSAPELGLPEPPGAAGGLLVLDAGSAEPGQALTEALGLRPDVVFDLDITPNRPDALSMAGIARDLAAALGERWAPPAFPPAPDVDTSLAPPAVTVAAGDLCPRFTATVLTGVPRGPSTPEIARRLTLAGMRPINAVVDVSNYVMLDVGQPNHAYDLDRLGGHGILVRRAGPGERIVTLDGVERSLVGDDCLICAADGRPVGVAGIMGGASAEIDEATERVLLECAWFDPRAVARTGNRLGLTSEARARFERGADPAGATAAVERFCALLASVPGGEGLRRGRTADVRHDSLPGPAKVRLRPARVASLLGIDVTPEQVEGLLAPLGFELAAAGDGFEVTVPTWRLEVSREADLVEEVARMWGYQRIERTVPAGARRRTGGLTPYQQDRRRVRRILAGAGLAEAWTNTFLAPADLAAAGLDPTAVEVANPLDRSESRLRPSLRPGLLRALRVNIDRQLEDLALFEIGRVFAPPADGSDPLPVESERLGVILLPPAGGQRGGAAAGQAAGQATPGQAAGQATPGPAATPGSTRAVESAVEAWRWLAAALRIEAPSVVAATSPGLHPGRTAELRAGDTVVGVAGEVDPEVVAAHGLPGPVGWVDIDLAALHRAARRSPEAVEVSRFPASDVDLAFVLDDTVPASELVSAVAKAGGDLLEEVELFDVYRGERIGTGRRSLAVRVRLRAADRTLIDAELSSRREELIAAGRSVGAELRS